VIAGRSILAVVPARGGSKGIKHKNLRTVAGVPMVARVGDCVKAMVEIDRAVVSTDHEEIAMVAEAAGIAAPFRRPKAISGDRIGDIDVLRHALAEMERIDARTYDIVLMLQPTSPLRRPEHVTASLEMLIEGDWDAVWTVSETDPKAHPLKQLTITEGRLDYWDKRGAGIIARQELAPVYHRNGVAYALTRRCLTEQNAILGARTGALGIDDVIRNYCVEIDDVRFIEPRFYFAFKKQRLRGLNVRRNALPWWRRNLGLPNDINRVLARKIAKDEADFAWLDAFFDGAGHRQPAFQHIPDAAWGLPDREWRPAG